MAGRLVATAGGTRPSTDPEPKPEMSIRPPHAHRKLPGSRLPAWRLLLALGLAVAPAVADDLDPATRQILIDGVAAASAMDFYYARCRGDISGRQTDNLNKLLVGKLRTTVLSVEDDLFPQRNYRLTRQQLEQDFLDTLRNVGGCPGAKESGLPDRLRARYDSALDAIRALP